MVKHLELNEDLFEVIKEGNYLVDFYTEWCGPCKMLAEVLEEVDYVNVLKVDAEKFNDLAVKFGVMSVPTICFFKNGELVKKEIGYRNPVELKNIYEEISK